MLTLLFTYLHFSIWKKFISSQEELEWKGTVAKFFYKKMNVEQRLQESWWAGTRHKVRKGIDSKRATVAATVKNEFMSKYIEFKSLYIFISSSKIIL